MSIEVSPSKTQVEISKTKPEVNRLERRGGGIFGKKEWKDHLLHLRRDVSS